MSVGPLLRLMRAGNSRVLFALIGVLWAGGGICDTGAQSVRMADIRWTAYGIPHIRADNELGLGYGIGYAYARDNACLLMEEVITARGERSRFFGANGSASAHLDNLTSDVFHAWLNGAAKLDAFWNAQPEPVRLRLTGYVQGFNRYLGEPKVLRCRNEPWLRPISEHDLVGLTRSLLVEGGLKQFIEPLVAATKPFMAGPERIEAESPPETYPKAAGYWSAGKPISQLGSNAIAIGSARSANGKGLLLANPHFPWLIGRQRFYQMHLTIPGQLDVMGAALPGLPMINIGFNHRVAWTHTVDALSHFTLHRLTLDPSKPGHYLVDGRSEPLQKTSVVIAVRDRDGALSAVTRQVFESRYGPVVVIPGLLEWRDGAAYALQDANLGNTRVLQKWDAINRAEDALQIRDAVEKIQGIPWVNTVAVDESGRALYMNQSVIPHLSAAQLESCAIAAFAQHGLVVLDGGRSQCNWMLDGRAAQPGIVPPQLLPVLVREDYVQNSNDSAWLSNPASPLTGFSPLVSREGRPLGPRARFALDRLQQDGKLNASDLQRMLTENRVHLGSLLLDDLFKLCALEKAGPDIRRPCSSLAHWDGTAGLASGQGLLVFNRFLERFLAVEKGWRQPFNPLQPINTPYGINLADPTVTAAVATALANADAEIHKLGLTENARWGELQVATRGDRKIGIPGGAGEMGVYNVIESEWRGGHLEVTQGSSYIQLVTFTEAGPQAQGLLTYSQSSDPSSAHYTDQTELFSRQVWPNLPFNNEQIEVDPALERMTLWQH